jgi:hypothetical protein
VTSSSIDITIENRDEIDHWVEIVIGADLAIGNDTQPFGYYEWGESVSFASHGFRFLLGLPSGVYFATGFVESYPELAMVDDPGKFGGEMMFGSDTALRLNWSESLFPQSSTTLSFSVSAEYTADPPTIQVREFDLENAARESYSIVVHYTIRISGRIGQKASVFVCYWAAGDPESAWWNNLQIRQGNNYPLTQDTIDFAGSETLWVLPDQPWIFGLVAIDEDQLVASWEPFIIYDFSNGESASESQSVKPTHSNVPLQLPTKTPSQGPPTEAFTQGHFTQKLRIRSAFGYLYMMRF